MQFLVRVFSPGDDGAFKEALSDASLSLYAADDDWVATVTADLPKPAGATYYAVTTDGQQQIDKAVEDSARHRMWP